MWRKRGAPQFRKEKSRLKGGRRAWVGNVSLKGQGCFGGAGLGSELFIHSLVIFPGKLGVVPRPKMGVGVPDF